MDKRNFHPDHQAYHQSSEDTPAAGTSQNLVYQSSYDNPPISCNTPLHTDPVLPPPPIPTALMMSPGGRLATHNPQSSIVTVPIGQLSPEEKAVALQMQPPIKQPIPIQQKQQPSRAALEMEDTTTETASRGSSWTMRFPWFRKKRSRKQAREDNDYSTTQKGTSEDDLYYGGLMKSASPSSLSVEASSTVANMEPGQYAAHVHAAQHHHPHPDMHRSQQQHQPQPQMPEQAPDKQKRKNSGQKSYSKSQRQSKHTEHQLLPQHTPPPPPPPPTTSYHWADNNINHNTLLPEHSNTNKVFRNRSWISTSSKGSSRRKGRRNASDEDSLADFDETEWTPQDSAYGAAIPVCGWIPKRLRQFIEATLIVFGVFALVYLVVTTSIALSEHKSSKHVSHQNDTTTGNSATTYDSGVEVDDDWYIEYRNDGSNYYYNDRNDADDDNRGG